MPLSPLKTLLSSQSIDDLSPELVAYLANLSCVAEVAPSIAEAVVRELHDQRSNLKLIASENFCSLATQAAMGNLLTDKYSEGFPRHRFYAGCDNVDEIESFACQQACELFGADHAYVQPHSGADANLIACWAILSTRVQAPSLEAIGQTDPSKLSRADWDTIRTQMGNQRMLGLDYYAGGHLTHGYRQNISAQMFDAYTYGVDPESGLIDYDDIARQAAEIKPLILLAGYSAYPRHIDFSRMREIADSVGAVLWVDMAHFAGLVAGKAFEGIYNPVAYADIVTTTTHKTLRGPRGGMILCTDEFAQAVDKGCPMVIGGPLPHVMAAKAVALVEARKEDFQDYSRRIVENARVLAQACVDQGMTLATGGTDNHLMLIDVQSFGLTGRQAESVMRECGITLNRNSLPNDPNGPWYASGLRVGTPAVTTLGMGPEQMDVIARLIKLVLSNTRPAIIEGGPNSGKPSRANYEIDPGAKEEALQMGRELLAAYPVYPELDLGLLQELFGG